MTKFARMLDVLDLYSEEVTLLSAEEMATRLQVSRPTAFRYVRELSAAGFLANVAGRYALGARIITLDHRIRASDPVLREARDLMSLLCAETGCSAILCRMYNDEIINTHHVSGYEDAPLSFFGRGRPLPLFRGSASKVMLAFLPPARLKRIYENHREHPDVKAFADSWPAFRAYYAAIRQRGHYLSNQEVDQGTVGLAAPIQVPQAGTLGAVSLVFSVQRLALVNTDGLAAMLTARMRELGNRLAPLVASSQTGSTPKDPTLQKR